MDFVRRLNGMFAFALWDQRSRTLVAARDPFGVKPLYWWTDGRRVALASEVRRAAGRGARGAARWTAWPSTTTWRAASCRRRARCSRASPSSRRPPCSPRARARRRGSPATARPPGPRSTGSGARSSRRQLAERFTDAVERQMMSDVPYGAFLSGGVDSAAIAAAMAQRGEHPPSTFTIGFPGHGNVLDEREYAAGTARALGTDHHDTAMEQARLPLRAASAACATWRSRAGSRPPPR